MSSSSWQAALFYEFFGSISGELPYNKAMPRSASAREARLEARISPVLKRRLEYAASLRGSTLTEFVVQSAHEAATRAIREHEVLTLTERARVEFANLLLAPPRPNRKAKAAARRYKAQLASGAVRG
jgi:uncharacterized protein (DUF1778 family)